MISVTAHLRYVRVAPRKMRLVADSIRKRPYREALEILAFLPKRGSKPLLKLLRSAGANAKNNFNLDTSSLLVKEILVDAGPVLKRFMPRAMGRAALIRKRRSHITLVLDEIQDKKL